MLLKAMARTPFPIGMKEQERALRTHRNLTSKAPIGSARCRAKSAPAERFMRREDVLIQRRSEAWVGCPVQAVAVQTQQSRQQITRKGVPKSLGDDRPIA